MAASTVPDPGRCRPPGPTRRGKGPTPATSAPTWPDSLTPEGFGGVPRRQWIRAPAPWPDSMFPGALPPCLVRSGWHGCSRVLPGPGAPLPPHASRSRQRGKRLRKRTLAATPAVAGMQSPWRAPAPQDGSTIAARVAAPGARFPLQASRTRKRENGRVDADTWFQTTLPSRKSPNLSNTESVCGGP